MKTIKEFLKDIDLVKYYSDGTYGLTKQYGTSEYITFTTDKNVFRQYYGNSITFDLFPSLKKVAEEHLGDYYLSKELIITTNPSAYTKEVFVPQIPRDHKINTIEDFLSLPLNSVTTTILTTPKTVDVIVCRHESTIELLKSIFGKEIPVITGNVLPEDIKDKKVAGVLPPNLISLTKSMSSVTIKDYDRDVDGDMSLDDMKNRGFDIKTIIMEVKEL